jgi:hypothetical protein
MIWTVYCGTAGQTILNCRPLVSGDIVQFALDSQGNPRNDKKFKKCPSMNYPQFDPLFIWIL